MSLQPISKALANPAAQRVFTQMMALPDDESAQMYATMVISGALQHDLATHHEVIQKRIDDIIAKRIEAVKHALSRSAIAKSRNGEDIDSVVAAATVIAKDFGFSAEERRKFAERQDRDSTGRFRTMHHKVNYIDRSKPLPNKHAQRIGIKEPTNANLSGRDLANYQQAYMALANALIPFTHLEPGEAMLHLTYTKPGATPVTETMDMPANVENGRFNNLTELDPVRFQNGGKLSDVHVSVNPNLTAQGAAFDLVGALGGGAGTAGQAARLYGQDDDGRFHSATRLGEFNDAWDKVEDGEFDHPSNRVFRRISEGAKLLDSMAGPAARGRTKLAIETANFVGQHGPEASRVIGPHADRAAYRYRGVERKPDAALQQIVNSARNRFGDDSDAARNALIYGEPGAEEVRGNRVVRGEPRQSPLITYFGGMVDREGNTRGGRLPNADLGNLQVKSGVVPPSEGIIIDRKGQVITQAVGYGDDWYLPFNLKTLSKLKGGEYIRTRTWGGPTTEDIYAALVTHARALTVISHNGVYTIEFDNSFRGGRRFNDKAARMVKRYGHLLDAVKSKEVTLASIPPDRLDELRGEAAREFDPRRERLQYENKLQELRNEEIANPQMSEATRQAAAEVFLEEKASNLVTDVPGHKDWTNLAESYVDHQVAESRALHDMLAAQGPVAPFDDIDARRMAASRVSTPEATIATYGWDGEWNRYIARAEEEYKAKQSPLNLDGAGYDKAMSALREQFPYYIASTSWQPRRRGGFDSGYVKPKYNRPADALSGYYDPTIAGFGTERDKQGKLTGKTTADRTRYQNAGISAKVRGDVKFRERRNAAGEVINPPRRESEGGAAPAEGIAGVAQVAQREAAVRRLREALRNQRTVMIPDANGVMQPRAITEVAGRLSTNLPLIFGSNEAFDTAMRNDPQGAMRELHSQVRRYVDHGFGQVDQNLIDAAFNPAQADRGASWNVAEAVRNKRRLFDFGDEYAPNRRPEYYANLGRQLAQRIPDANFDGDNLDQTLDAYIDGEWAKFLGHGVPGHRYRNADLTEAENNIKRATQVRVLRRRYTEALARQQEQQAEAQRRADEQRRRGLGQINILGDPESYLRDLQERREQRGLERPPSVPGQTEPPDEDR